LRQMFPTFEANSGTIQRKRGMFKKAVQQGRRAFGEWSVHGVREHAQSPRTQLGAFFNIPRKGSEDLAISSEPAVDPANLGQAPRLNFVFFGIEFRVGMSHGVFEIWTLMRHVYKSYSGVQAHEFKYQDSSFRGFPN